MKNFFLLFIAFYFCLSGSFAQVICNNNGTGITGTINPGSVTISGYTIPTGNNSLIVVATTTSNDMTPTSIIFNGMNLQLLGSEGPTDSQTDQLWYLALGNITTPMTGDIVVTSGGFIINATATSFQNVNQLTPMANFTSTSLIVSSTSSSLTINCNPGDKAIDAISFQGDPNSPIFTPTSGQAIEVAVQNNVFGTLHSSLSVGGRILPTGSVMMNWDITNGGGASATGGNHIAAGIKSAGVLATSTPIAPVPTMSQWGLLVFGLLIMNLSVFFVQRRELI